MATGFSRDFKVAVLNYSGNVGKSTLARHLLQPRMQDCPIIFVETINEGGDDTNIKGKDFASVMAEVLASDRAIVDIGSSNIEQVFAKVGQMGDILEGFDFFLVPTVAKTKQQNDTTKMLLDLIKMDVPPEKIKVILNNADPEESVEKLFAHTLGSIKLLGFDYAVVHENMGYADLIGRTVLEAAAEGRNFKAEIAAASTKERKDELARAQVFSRMAKTIKGELDGVFAKLFLSSTVSP